MAVLEMLGRQMRVADAQGLPDPLLPARPGRPIGAGVAVDQGMPVGGLVVTFHDEGDQPGIGTEMPGVDDLDT